MKLANTLNCEYIIDLMDLPKINIKFMVSLRCKMMVKEELKKLQIPYASVQLGEVELFNPLTKEQHDQLQKNLRRSGLELLDDKITILINKIKSVIVEMVHYTDEVPKVNYSDYISEKLNYDYTYLSNIFSEVTGITIQQYIIIHKIERVKELLLYDELNLTQIADLLHYSSVAHLSNQFKKITDLSPSYFKSLKKRRITNLDDL
ncbi:MAG: AraC family transcriptional regulator [Cyclobacteriaceae bacterium]